MIAHTVLEGWAFDEFHCLQAVFRDDLLGAIYRAVRQDEGRHVAIGIAATRASFVRNGFTEADSHDCLRVIRRGEALAAEVSGFADDSIEHLAGLAGRPFSELREWFALRHRSRLSRMCPEPSFIP